MADLKFKTKVSILLFSCPCLCPVQSPGPDPVQPRADHHSDGPHRGLCKSRGGGDEENQRILRERHGCYERKHKVQ